MPSRGKSQSARQGAQSTLAFGNKSRVTKPSLPILSAKKQAATSTVQVKTPDSPVVEVEAEPTAEDSVVQKQAEEEIHIVSRSPEEERAAKVSDVQLKRYWQQRESERKAPRGTTALDQLLRIYRPRLTFFWSQSTKKG